jgi:hypothetical protein
MSIIREERIGDCRLILGDATKIAPILFGFDSIVSDVPYGMGYQSGWATEELWGDEREIRGDRDTRARDLICLFSDQVPMLVFGTWKIERPAGTRQVLIWDKGGALGMGALDIPWKPDHEEIYVLGKGFTGRRDCGSVLYCPPVQSMAKNGRQHPNEKPVGLMSMLIRKVPGVILDPFMGSGSTLVAAARAGRRAIGIELHPGHFETACKRLRDAYRQPADMFALSQEGAGT